MKELGDLLNAGAAPGAALVERVGAPRAWVMQFMFAMCNAPHRPLTHEQYAAICLLTPGSRTHTQHPNRNWVAATEGAFPPLAFYSQLSSQDSCTIEDSFDTSTASM